MFSNEPVYLASFEVELFTLQGFKNLSVLLKDKDTTKSQTGNKGLGTSLLYTV
jgi:hypothetical protein